MFKVLCVAAVLAVCRADEITDSIQAASNTVLGFVDEVVPNADHTLSAADKEDIKALEQRVEQLVADMNKLANKHGENFRLQFAAETLATVEDALEDVAEDQQSYDSRSIDISFYQTVAVVRVLVECFAAYSLFNTFLPFLNFIVAPLWTIFQLVFTIMAFIYPYVACLLPAFVTSTTSLFVMMPSLAAVLLASGLAPIYEQNKPLIDIIVGLFTSHAITLRLFLDFYGCNLALSKYVFGTKKSAAKQDQLAAKEKRAANKKKHQSVNSMRSDEGMRT
jgi:hypothetical protein